MGCSFCFIQSLSRPVAAAHWEGPCRSKHAVFRRPKCFTKMTQNVTSWDTFFFCRNNRYIFRYLYYTTAMGLMAVFNMILRAGFPLVSFSTFPSRNAPVDQSSILWPIYAPVPTHNVRALKVSQVSDAS